MFRIIILPCRSFFNTTYRSKSSNVRFKDFSNIDCNQGNISLNLLSNEPAPNKITIDEHIIAHLESLSLVNCANKEGIKILEDAILFAQKVLNINTDGVLPLYTVLETKNLELRSDIVTGGNCQKDILKNSNTTLEDYFVAPQGNIPLQSRPDLLHKNKTVKNN
ncbi:glutamyl-tRNA(Gln) amidotransferase subunit C, mitochondrial [Arctopsyche grandis]|uniref:glutamyl-tRNA(Gln) amidotransferase subunit C, mitochondrial n=1 Tax=Arctopsyche grandis TaxID=121162 RepID=UPI00406D7DD6